mgnify:CR=1 FL=1
MIINKQQLTIGFSRVSPAFGLVSVDIGVARNQLRFKPHR